MPPQMRHDVLRFLFSVAASSWVRNQYGSNKDIPGVPAAWKRLPYIHCHSFPQPGSIHRPSEPGGNCPPLIHSHNRPLIKQPGKREESKHYSPDSTAEKRELAPVRGAASAAVSA